MKPYFDDGKGIVIYHGDCRETLPQLEQVDLVMADPQHLGQYALGLDVTEQPLPEQLGLHESEAV